MLTTSAKQSSSAPSFPTRRDEFREDRRRYNASSGETTIYEMTGTEYCMGCAMGAGVGVLCDWVVLNLGAWIGIAIAPFRIWDRVHMLKT